MGTITTESGIAGTWGLVIGTPRGDRPATLVLEQDGGKVTGTMNEIAIEDGAWADGGLTFTAQLTEPVKVKVRCTVRVEVHTEVSHVGRIAAAAGVPTLALNHFVPASRTTAPQQWTKRISEHYDGRIIVAEDLTSLPVRGSGAHPSEGKAS
jgi:hypothetical protein